MEDPNTTVIDAIKVLLESFIQIKYDDNNKEDNH